MTRFAFRLTGPDRYCPHCGRWLVRINDDGTFDLAAKAGIDAKHTVWIAGDEIEDEATNFEAICLRTKCRIKDIISSAIRS